MYTDCINIIINIGKIGLASIDIAFGLVTLLPYIGIAIAIPNSIINAFQAKKELLADLITAHVSFEEEAATRYFEEYERKHSTL